MTETRLVAWAPNGAKLGPLPTPEETQVSFPLNDVGALGLKYPPVAPRSELLGQPVEVAVEVSYDAGMTWAEPPGARFLYLRDGRDPIKDDSYSVECPGYVKRLEKALVSFVGLSEEGKRDFSDATPGAILHALMTEAQARGALAGLTWSFTGATDSAGVAWPVTASFSYDPGTSVLAILLGLAESAFLDFRTNGRALEVFVADTSTGMAADRTTGANPVSLRYGRDLTEAPFRRTWEGLADAALILGDGGSHLERTNPSALAPWGRQEVFVTASGVTDPGTLAVLGDANLELSADARREDTFGLDFALARALPLRDYAPGEYVWKAVDGAAPERVRVRQVTLTKDNTGRSAGNVVLNDRFLEQDILTARKISRVTGGATGATPGLPTPAGNDILAPAAPDGLVHTTTAYLDRRVPSAQVTLTWDAVTTNADGTPIGDLAGYEVWRRQPTAAWSKVADVQAGTVTWSDSPYAPGSSWEFRIRAVDSVFNYSAFSATEEVTMASDIVPPPKPSAPVLGTRNGILEAAWDGLAATGGAMPGDVQRVEVHRSQVDGFTPTAGDRDTLVSTLYGPGTALVSSLLAADSVWFVKLVAVDWAGNPSEPSDQDSVAVEAIAVGEEPPAPASSPAPSVTPLGILALQATWPSVAGADYYRVYVSDATMPGADPADLFATISGTSLVISRLPSGAGLPAGAPVYVRVVAGNSSGDAAPGAEASGTPRLADSADISPSYVYTGGVSAGQIETGELSAVLALVGGLTAGEAGGRSIVLDGTDGFKVLDGTGQPLVHFPLDPEQASRFTGDLVANGFTTTGRAQFRGTENEISTASTFTLANGVTPPANLPSFNDYREAKTPTGTHGFAMSGDGGTNVMGMVLDAGVLYVSSLGIGGPSNPNDWYGVYRLTLSTMATMAPIRFIPSPVSASEYLDVADGQPRPSKSSGLTKIGGTFYRMEQRFLYGPTGAFDPASDNYWYVVGYSASTGAQVSAWQYQPYSVVPSTGTGSGNHPTLGVDGSALLILQANVSGQPILRRFAVTGGAPLSTVNLGAPLSMANGYVRFASILKGNFDFGATRYVVQVIGTGEFSGRVYDAAGVEQPGDAFQTASQSIPRLAWDGTRFLSYEGSTSVYLFTTAKTARTFYLAYTWYDSTTAGTGTHETTLSPVLTYTTKPRWGLQGGAPSSPPGNPEDDDDAPDSWRLYAAEGVAYPGPGGMKLQPSATGFYDIFGTVYSYQYTPITDALANGPLAPTLNTFPDGSAAILKSAVGGFIVRGDGTGAWPFLTDAFDDQAAANQAALDAKMAEVDAKLAEVQGLPIGSEIAWPGPLSTVPDGWKVEDGSELPIADYPTLYNRLTSNGTVFPHGANTNGSGGAGTTHFRLPNAKGRVVVGQDPAQTEFDAIGETGGEKRVTLTARESGVQAHTHAMPAGTNPVGSGTQDTFQRSNVGNDGNFRTGGVADPSSAYGSTFYGTAGKAAIDSHQNLQPYTVRLWIIKASGGTEVQEMVTEYPARRYSYYSGDNNTGFSGSWPAAWTIVPGMSLTIPSAPYDRTLWLDASVVHDGGHANRFAFFRDGVQLSDTDVSETTGTTGAYSWSAPRIRATIGANAAAVTFDIRTNASDSTAGGQLYERSMTVDALPGLGNEHALGSVQVTGADPVLDSGWVTVTPRADYGWQNYSPDYPVRYRKKDGVVFVKGLVKLGIVGPVLPTMPLGFRPSSNEIFDAKTSGNGTAWLEFSADGTVGIYALSANGWVSLSCSYLAD